MLWRFWNSFLLYLVLVIFMLVSLWWWILLRLFVLIYSRRNCLVLVGMNGGRMLLIFLFDEFVWGECGFEFVELVCGSFVLVEVWLLLDVDVLFCLIGFLLVMVWVFGLVVWVVKFMVVWSCNIGMWICRWWLYFW